MKHLKNVSKAAPATAVVGIGLFEKIQILLNDLKAPSES